MTRLRGPCSIGFRFIHLDAFAPERIGVSVNGLTLTEDFAPPYRKFFPNGEHCPGECRVATVLLDFGSSRFRGIERGRALARSPRR